MSPSRSSTVSGVFPIKTIRVFVPFHDETANVSPSSLIAIRGLCAQSSGISYATRSRATAVCMTFRPSTYTNPRSPAIQPKALVFNCAASVNCRILLALNS